MLSYNGLLYPTVSREMRFQLPLASPSLVSARIETVFERSKVKERLGTQEPIFEILAASASEAWLMLEMRESVFFRLKRRVRNNKADPLKWQSRMSSAILGGTRKILAAGCVG